jgi:signal peptidase II
MDQVLKIVVKSTMYPGEEIRVLGDWFILHFTENNGMAFGMEFAGSAGKVFLTLFRIVAVGGIIWYLRKLINEQAPRGLIICLSLILAGALGNILDSVFYGVLFGYEQLLFGRVVDMFYFPIYHGMIPEWLPFFRGQDFIFFRPVFNIADTAISTGVISLLVFQKKYFKNN